ARASLIAYSRRNARNIKAIEESCFCLTLTDSKYKTPAEGLHDSLMGDSRLQWADKCANVVVTKNGGVHCQGENIQKNKHSNVDAIVILQAGDDAANRSRKSIWQPKEVPFDIPQMLEFDLSPDLLQSIEEAERTFNKLSRTYGVESVIYDNYGNNLVRDAKLYADTIVQIAIQLAFYRTHGRFAPIYETASTRKFYHGRTETVRGCTHELVAFVRAITEQKSVEEHRRLFTAAYDAHNKLMEDCMNGKGIGMNLSYKSKKWKSEKNG
ncbi:Choline/Carnitine O-acyltransferase, partial [Oesophagostomum dentatum]